MDSLLHLADLTLCNGCFLVCIIPLHIFCLNFSSKIFQHNFLMRLFFSVIDHIFPKIRRKPIFLLKMFQLIFFILKTTGSSSFSFFQILKFLRKKGSNCFITSLHLLYRPVFCQNILICFFICSISGIFFVESFAFTYHYTQFIFCGTLLLQKSCLSFFRKFLIFLKTLFFFFTFFKQVSVIFICLIIFFQLAKICDLLLFILNFTTGSGDVSL